MKLCTVCGINKLETAFYFRSKAKNHLHTQCKDCYALKRKLTYSTHYKNNASSYISRASSRNALIRNSHKRQMLEYLQDKYCAVCGINDPRVLDFDHIDPTTKSFGVAKALHDGLRWDKSWKN